MTLTRPLGTLSHRMGEGWGEGELVVHFGGSPTIMELNTTHRVLMVTDDQRLLATLRTSFNAQNDGWEMAFAQGSREALEAVNSRHFDVVLAELCLAGMNGAELLNEVMQRQPCVLRFLLAGKADADLTLQCSGLPHQYLVKPDDAEGLKTVVRRVLELESSLTNRRLRQLISKLDRLPSVPALYVEIVERLQDPEVCIDDIGAIIAKDIGMTAKILKLVNSAVFGLRRQIGTPAEAVNYLGVEAVKSLVLTLQVFSQFDHVRQCGFPVEAVWEHSVNTGMAARAIARVEGGDRALGEESFVAGLLHDSGKLVLASNFPEHYEEILRQMHEHGATLLEGERQFFQADHADIGGYLLGLWGLPGALVDAVAHHHRPARAQSPTITPLGAVCLANELVQEPRPAHPNDPPAGRLASVLAAYGQADRLPAWREAVFAVLPELKPA